METEMFKKKKKVLVWADVPSCATGFATVSRNILKQLQKTDEYVFTIIGINYAGGFYDQLEYPYIMYPAANALTNDPRYKDVYGRQQLVDHASSGLYDIIFMIQDTFIVETFIGALKQAWDKLPKEKKFSVVYYFPIDGKPKAKWIKDVVSEVDFPVAYTYYAKEECLKHDPSLDKMPVIYHGVDKNIFYPFPADQKKQIRAKFFEKHADKFIIMNVSRNQPRKDLHKTFAAFSLLHQQHPNTFLFLLSQADDVGGNLINIAENYGLVWDKDWACPAPGTYGANQGYSIDTVVALYNSCDLVVSTTLGEGFGLSTLEAMACKVPILMPKNTSLVEIIGENEERGFFCNSGKSINDWICLGTADNDILRPTVDALDMADKMEFIMQHREEVSECVENAYKDVWTWEQVGEQWKEIFEKAALQTVIYRTEKQGRNDPCLCGSGKKAKNCCKNT